MVFTLTPRCFAISFGRVPETSISKTWNSRSLSASCAAAGTVGCSVRARTSPSEADTYRPRA